MKRKFTIVIMSCCLLLLLSACNKSVEERAEETVKVATETFGNETDTEKETVANFQMYVPKKFEVKDQTDEQNIILYKGNQPFILFVNPNEKTDSQLFYNLLKDSGDATIIAEKTFEKENVFGFAAVLESDDAHVELVANIGGKKMTTITKNKQMTEDMERMIEMLNSIE